MTTGYITLLSLDLQRNYYIKNVVLFEENSILLLPDCSGVFWMVVFEGWSLPRKSEKSVKIGKNQKDIVFT